MKKRSTLITILVILLIAAGLAYWYVFFNGPGATVTPTVTGNNQNPTRFQPFTSSPVETSTPTPGADNGLGNTVDPGMTDNTPLSSLRLLSNTPVGGYGASTTASGTIVRWVDRGRGNIFEVNESIQGTVTLSNTILPRTYESLWNKNLTAFIGSIFSDTSNSPTVVYAELKNRTGNSTTTGEAVTPFELKGKNLPSKMIGYAVSPKKDKIFFMTNESGKALGYVSNFDGSGVVNIFTSPLTQVNIDWPEDNTIAITTKGTASQNGFLYFINPKTGAWKKALGPLLGLSAKISHDAKFVVASYVSSQGSITTNIYSLGTTTAADANIKTLADKCAWGNFDKYMLYCATPNELPDAAYPDDWYTGKISFTDKIWSINATTGEIHLVTTIVDQSDRLIDAYNLGLDSKDNYLFFMNKKDLSLWSFDLVAGL